MLSCPCHQNYCLLRTPTGQSPWLMSHTPHFILTFTSPEAMCYLLSAFYTGETEVQ